jgi:LysR family transcriptional activator of nhaA
MKPAALNYRHLHYFWVVAQEGSVTRAAERLGVAVQTVSAQLALLERSLGKTLLAPQGRRLLPTEAGRLALGYADQIFQLGEEMRDALVHSEAASGLRLAVGIADALPKLIVYRLLEPALRMPERVRLICHEGGFDALLADLALHRLDVVLTDRPASAHASLRVFNHPLGEYRIAIFGTAALAQRHGQGFPHSLTGAPLLLPTRNNALRGRIDQWLASHRLRPDIVGEFDDSALMMTCGRTGLGLFPAPMALAEDIAAQFDAAPIGELNQVAEQFYAISSERRIRHPAVETIRAARADRR